MPGRPTRTGSGLLAGAAAAALAVGLVVGLAPASSAASYRYWTYWQAGDDGWDFATAGPASVIPEDGSVQGWRFTVTSATGGGQDAPRAPADFAAICADTPAEPDRKRVALVVDPGDASIAPAGEAPPPTRTDCLVVDPAATGYDVLRAAVAVRTEDGLVCGIDGYPAEECAPVVEEPASGASAPASAPASPPGTPDAPQPAPTSASAGMSAPADPGAGGTPWLTVAVLAVAAGGAWGLWRWRRA